MTKHDDDLWEEHARVITANGWDEPFSPENAQLLARICMIFDETVEVEIATTRSAKAEEFADVAMRCAHVCRMARDAPFDGITDLGSASHDTALVAIRDYLAEAIGDIGTETGPWANLEFAARVATNAIRGLGFDPREVIDWKIAKNATRPRVARWRHGGRL